ncbi:LOW QUALITY PROTEIN: hypothetical protein HID58_009838, partial [Brassica napus]
LLYLNSLGISFLTLFNCHPPLHSSTLSSIKPVVDYMTTPPINFSLQDICHLVSMCPNLLTSYLTSHTIPSASTPSSTSVTPSSSSPRVQRQYTAKTCALVPPGNWYPRYVETHLPPLLQHQRQAPPTQSRNLGFLAKGPPRCLQELFNYSVAENYELKVSYLVGEIGRDMREILESTQYFSFSLENWIKPRHEACVAKEVRFPLAVMMKTKRWVCSDSSPPLKTSGLICVQKDSLFLEFWTVNMESKV